jgi:uncharacterized protein (DUF58 family)
MDAPSTGLSPVKRVTLRFRRIYILPTRQGMGFAAAVSVMLLGSINYGNALGYVLSFLLIGAALVSMLHAVRNLAGLDLRWDESDPVFAGDTAHFALQVDNRGKPKRFGLLARLAARRRLRRRRDDNPVLRFHLDADSVARIELPAVASRRGWFSPGHVTLATRFPFGWFRAWSRVDARLRCLAYPRPAGEQTMPIYEPEACGEHGSHGQGEDEFSGLRDYRPGDSARRVHWKAVARGQAVPVKVFSGASTGSTWLRWQDVTDGDTESRLSQLSRWVIDADARNLQYGLVLPGIEIPPDADDEHRHRCLEALALYDDASTGHARES